MVQEFGFPISGSQIEVIIRTSRKVPMWEKALIKIGFPATWLERQKQLFTEVVRERQRQGLPLNSEAFLQDSSPLALQILKQVTGESLTPQAFRQRAMRKFKDWESLLLASGLNPESVVKRSVSLSPRAIQKIITQIYELNPEFDFSPKNMKEVDSPLFRDVTFSVVGSRISAESVYRMALEVKPWAQWIRDLELDYRKMRRTNKQLTEDEIIRGLRALHDNDIPLNAQALSQNKSVFGQDIIYQEIGFKITAAQLYNSAIHKKKWLLWLSAAGFDITQIQLRGSIPYDLVNRVTQLALRRIAQARTSLVGDSSAWQMSGELAERIRIDESDGEARLIQKEFSESFSEFDKLLNKNERALLQNLIDSLEEGYDLNEAVSLTASSFGLDSQQSVIDLLQKISQHPRFIEMFKSTESDIDQAPFTPN